VTKLSSEGSTVVWSTFIGGNGADNGLAIALDATGNAFIAGSTSSTDFPTTSGALRRNYAGGVSDGFVVKLGANGGVLGYSTYLGGGADDLADAIALDGAGNATIGGYTGSTDFPTTPGVVKTTRVGSFFDTADGFVSKLDPAGAHLVYSTYIGAEGGTDEVTGLALDYTGRATITGMTQSSNFPTTAGAYGRVFGGYWDGFVARLNGTGTAYVYSTLLPGSGYDEPSGVALDAGLNASVTGRTSSTDFPLTPNAPQGSYRGGGYDAFVTRVSPDGGSLVYSTYLGGGGSEQGFAIVVAPTGQACITGWSDATNFPVTAGAYDVTANGGQDAFLTVLSPSGGAISYSTYLGASDSDLGRALSLRTTGDVVVAGYTTSAAFPTSAAAYDRTQNSPGEYDVFVSTFDVGLGGTVDVDQAPAGSAPTLACPNPFRNETAIRLSLPRAGRVSVEVFDLRGRRVRVLAAGEFAAGLQAWKWDGRDQRGVASAPGVYYVRVDAAGERSAVTVSLLR
jgi:hypothetical protein